MAAVILAAVIVTGAAAAEEKRAPRGGRVGWARLITGSSQWAILSDQDPKLASFSRKETSLNIDPTWYSVYATDLEKLCTYPFVYVKDLTEVRTNLELDHLAEFLRRGGFLCVDPCTTRWGVNDLKRFIDRHREVFMKMFPDCEMRELPDSHELYHCYFAVGVDDLFSKDMIAAGASRPPRIGMQGVFRGERMVAVISTSGLECGWPQTPGRAPGCMKMIVNSYVYAMTR